MMRKGVCSECCATLVSRGGSELCCMAARACAHYLSTIQFPDFSFITCVCWHFNAVDSLLEIYWLQKFNVLNTFYPHVWLMSHPHLHAPGYARSPSRNRQSIAVQIASMPNASCNIASFQVNTPKVKSSRLDRNANAMD